MVIKNCKEALGFDNPKEAITIFKGNTYQYLDWFRGSNARYSTIFGWYVIGEEEVPNPLPVGITPIELKWELVSSGEELKPKAELKVLIDNLTHDPTNSKYIGEVGERLMLELTVTKEIPINSIYGDTNMYIMKDADENEFIWTTAARKLNVSSKYSLSGTVKEHKIYKNSRQTILTRCRIKNEII